LDNFYFPTQSATGGIFSSVGDVIAQTTSSGNDKKYDPRRTLNYFLKGLGGGIMWACWFQFADNWSLDLTRKVLLDRFALEEPSPNIERATRTAISIILEQFLVCPVFYAFWDIPVPALLSGSPMRQIPSQIESKLGPLLVENAKVWTPLNLITYNIPLEFRILFTSCADILWQSINAGITSQEILVPQRSSIGASNMGASNATDASLTPAVEEAL
jgi:protein Mpv17